METKKDIERRERLKEWFSSDPYIWEDLLEELEISLQNEVTQLESRGCTNREWSSGWVASHKFIMAREDYFKRRWTAPKETTSQKPA